MSPVVSLNDRFYISYDEYRDDLMNVFHEEKLAPGFYWKMEDKSHINRSRQLHYHDEFSSRKLP